MLSYIVIINLVKSLLIASCNHIHFFTFEIILLGTDLVIIAKHLFKKYNFYAFLS